MQLKSTTAVSLLLLASCEALRILVVFPMSTKNHNTLGHGIVNRLLEADHEVVHLTAIPRDEPKLKLKEIIVPDGIEILRKRDPESFDALTLKNMVGKSNYGDSLIFFKFAFEFHKLFLENSSVVEFLSDPKEKFDAVIVEWFFSDVIAGIAPLFDCPLIWFAPTEAHWQVIKLMDNIPSPAENVDLFSTHSFPLQFWDRVTELWKMIKKITIMYLYSYPKEKSLYNSYFPRIAAKRNITMSSYEKAVYNGSLLLLNSHPTLGPPRSLPQSAKYVGGYHIDPIKIPLPEDIKYLMDTARYGVVYINMGSSFKSSDMSEEMKQTLLHVFSKFKQRILWMCEGEMYDMPPNVFLIKWVPQPSILAYPKLRLFITHGDMLSTTEAMHYGVPIIGVPVLGDQFLNVDAVVRNGLGLKVDINDDNFAFELGHAMSRILLDLSFRDRARNLSRVYHDHPISPRKELSYWVEYVVNTQGAPHLRSPTLMMPWYKKTYFDLVALALTILLSIFKFIYQIMCYYRMKQYIKESLNKTRKSILNKKTD